MACLYCYVTVAYVCIPRRFLVINVCNQGKTLWSPCIISINEISRPKMKLSGSIYRKTEGFFEHGTETFSSIKAEKLTLRLLMSYIYGAPILDVSRSHTTTQHSR